MLCLKSNVSLFRVFLLKNKIKTYSVSVSTPGVNEGLKLKLQRFNLTLELAVVDLELRLAVIKYIVALFLNVLHNALVLDRDGLEALEFDRVQRGQTFDGSYNVGHLVQPLAERLELAKYVVLTKVPLALVLHGLELVAGLVKVLLILLEQPLALIDVLEQVVARYVPQFAVAVLDVLLARVYHLIGDFQE